MNKRSSSEKSREIIIWRIKNSKISIYKNIYVGESDENSIGYNYKNIEA